MFIDRLIESVKEKNNPSVMGLDPRLELIPPFIWESEYKKNGLSLKSAASAIYRFNTEMIDAVYDLIPAVKLQLAYYEMYGLDGMRVFEDTVKYAKEKNLLVIADGKRNDIGSTVRAYSAAFLGRVKLDMNTYRPVYDVDALTVNPYFGIDGIKPFLEDCITYGKGIFILVKTSNQSSKQLQDRKTQSGKRMYEIMAEYVDRWGEELTGKNGYSNVGAVVGATYPQQAEKLREIMKKAYILVPGYGAQGGTAEDAVKNFDTSRLGAVVNASRSIIYAYMSDKWKGVFDEKHYTDASRAEIIDMKNNLNKALETIVAN